jgi:hypothetical protein
MKPAFAITRLSGHRPAVRVMAGAAGIAVIPH